MLVVETIRDLADPRLAPFRTLKAQQDHLQREIFVAEGPEVVRRLVESSLEVISVVVPPKWQTEMASRLAARNQRPTLFVAELEVLERLTGFQYYQGVLALAQVPTPPDESTLGTARRSEGRSRGQLLLAADGLTNAENVGGLIRSAAALGADAFVSSLTCAAPYLRRAVRASMGNVFRLPCVRSPSLPQTLKRLRTANVRCLAAVLHPDATPIWDFDLTQDTCLVVGAEGDGLRSGVIAACDARVILPMHGGVDSLNVVCAATALLSEVARQRRCFETGSIRHHPNRGSALA